VTTAAASRYRLYGNIQLSSMATEAVLMELDVPFEIVRVNVRARGRTGRLLYPLETGGIRWNEPEFLALNPNGRVPVLTHDDVTVYEGGAICIYLADRHPEKGLAPAPGSPLRGPYLQWMFFLSNTLQELYFNHFHAERFTDDDGAVAGIREVAKRKLLDALRVLDGGIRAPGPFLMGEQYTTADAYLYMLTGWLPAEWQGEPAFAVEPTFPLTEYPRLRALREAVTARPAIRRMLTANKV